MLKFVACVQTWDVNKPAPDTLGGPFDLILASNAVHTCDNMAGAILNQDHYVLANSSLNCCSIAADMHLITMLCFH